MRKSDVEMYDRAYRERRWRWLESALKAARLRWHWDGGVREKLHTIRYLEKLLAKRPPYNPRRPNHWYWRQDQ